MKSFKHYSADTARPWKQKREKDTACQTSDGQGLIRDTERQTSDDSLAWEMPSSPCWELQEQREAELILLRFWERGAGTQ